MVGWENIEEEIGLFALCFFVRYPQLDLAWDTRDRYVTVEG